MRPFSLSAVSMKVSLPRTRRKRVQVVNSNLRRVVLNDNHSGFGLSREAAEILSAAGVPGLRLQEFPGDFAHDYRVHGLHDLNRDDPRLIDVVEYLGVERAGDENAALRVVEIPADQPWRIEDNFGRETVVWGLAAAVTGALSL